jgi:hypothetical protein
MFFIVTAVRTSNPAQILRYTHSMFKYYHVLHWLRRGFGLVIGFIGYLQVVTTNNYNTIADLHNLQSLHTNVFSLPALVLTDL